MPPKPDLKPYLGRCVCVTVDRPLGSTHPRFPGLIYPLNYGEIPGTLSGDGHPIDVYLLGWAGAVAEAKGVVIAVLEREDDAEDKLVVVPSEAESAAWSDEALLEAVAFQEQFFKVRLHRLALRQASSPQTPSQLPPMLEW